jgi:alpha-galactosidase
MLLLSKWLLLASWILLCTGISAQEDSLTLENSAVARTFYFSKQGNGFYTKSLVNKRSGQNYVNPATEEFSITINNRLIEGKDCKYLKHNFLKRDNTCILLITLDTPIEKVYLQLQYELYEGLPLVRKQLIVINESTRELELINLDVEKLRFQVVHKYNNEVYHNYGSSLTRIPYKGDYNDAAVMLYNPIEKQGAVFGNEAPSVLKNTEIYTRIHGCIQIGLTHIEDPFPFKKYLKPGETFKSPKTFISVFNSGKWQDGFENEFKEFTRKHLGVSLYKRKEKPLTLYDTWLPFEDSIDEKLIKDCADNLVNTGIDLFIIDAGWYRYSGDFIPDTSRFPKGMKFISDYLRKKGMQVGLWFPAAAVNMKSKVATRHPDWLIKDKDGKAANLHDMSLPTEGYGWHDGLAIMSLGSPYYEHIKNTVVSYIKELGLSYVKFDLAIANSAYVHDLERIGDYESNTSKLYKDRASSYWAIYERMMQLMDELHEMFPGLLIDCTYEVWGRYNIADYALVQHADYDWLTNFNESPPAGPVSIRQMNYDRSRIIPNAPLLIGNQSVNFSDYKYVYFSIASANCVLVGDPRKLNNKQQKFYQKWNSYLKQIEEQYQYSQYLQLYDVFDRPSYSNWDGCYRINTEKQGGLMFFYRNNSADSKRTFKIPCLDPANRYKIYDHEEGKTIGIFNGKFLIEDGVTVELPAIYTAKILTIEKI